MFGARGRDAILLWSAAGAMSAVAALPRLPESRSRWRIGLEGVKGVALAPAPVLTALAIATRRPLLAAAGLVLTADLVRDRPAKRVPAPRCPGGFRVVTANLLRGNSDVVRLGAAIAADHPDVVLLQELTPRHWADLDAAGVLAALPHRVLAPKDDYDGSALLSRWPLTEVAVHDVCGASMAGAVVGTPMGPVRFVAVHTRAPLRPEWIATWRRQFGWFADVARSTTQPLVLAGDFNATRHHRALRSVLRAGLRDAYDDAAAGPGMTWPQLPGTRFGLMRLDHVLVDDRLAVTAARVAPSPGSDHRRVLLDLRLAEPPAP